MKLYLKGKDQEYQPCIELDDGSVYVVDEVLIAIIKALEKKNVIKQKDIKDEI